ncbi:MAG: hypothetical protein ACFB6R_11430 [Alphaproteobacteria bacterium]
MHTAFWWRRRARLFCALVAWPRLVLLVAVGLAGLPVATPARSSPPSPAEYFFGPEKPEADAEPEPAPEPPVDPLSLFEVRENRSWVGRIYHYVRSNRDGSDPERISVFRKSDTDLAVFKARERCAPAALVTATLDLERFSPSSITGGRLLPGARVEPFAYLTSNPRLRTLAFQVDLPDRVLAFDVPFQGHPWHLYDFDLASLTVMTPYLLEPKTGFSFDLILSLADPDLPQPIAFLGRAEFTFDGEEYRQGLPAYRFRANGAAFGREEGQLWLHALEGHIVDVELPRANHLGYRDFKLTLQSVDDGGPDTWRTYLLAHHYGCPAER